MMQPPTTKQVRLATPTDAQDDLAAAGGAANGGSEVRCEPLAPLPPARLWLVDGYNVLHCAPFHRSQQGVVGAGARSSEQTSEPSSGQANAAKGAIEAKAGKPFWSATMRELLVAFTRCFPDPDAEIWLVFDGTRAPEEPHRGKQPLITLEFAPSADDWIVKRVRDSDQADQIAVVSGDRRLTGKTRHHGAAVVAPRLFLDHCIEQGASIPSE